MWKDIWKCEGKMRGRFVCVRERVYMLDSRESERERERGHENIVKT
jgi:hypothetical protein